MLVSTFGFLDAAALNSSLTVEYLQRLGSIVSCFNIHLLFLTFKRIIIVPSYI
jgi:hypothetical protein